MHDNIDPQGDDLTPMPPDEPGAAGEVFRRLRFGVGSRTTIMLGLTIGVVAVAAALPAYESWTVSFV